MRIGVSLPEGLVEKAKHQSQRNGQTLSGLIRILLEEHLREKEGVRQNV